MTTYIKETNGIPESLTPISLPKNTDRVSNFNRLDDETLRDYGYFPVVDSIQPDFDSDTQNISFTYEKQGSPATYVQVWTVTDKTQEELDTIATRKKETLKNYNSSKKEALMSQGFSIAPSGSPTAPVEVQTESLIDIINLMGSVLGAIVKKQANDTSPIPYRGKNKQQHILSNDEMIEIGMGVLGSIQGIYAKSWVAESKIDSEEITVESEIDTEYGA